MKWFKHDCDASNDSRIIKLKHKFGIEGYGVYFNTLELIGRKMEKDLSLFGFLPDEWDDEALEIEFKLSSDKVRTMFDYMYQIGLFEKKEGKLFNSKIVERCDDYTNRLHRLKQFSGIKSEHSSDSVRTKSDFVPPILDNTRLNKNNNILEHKVPATKIPSTRSCNNPKGHPDCIESIDSIQVAFKKQFPNYGKQVMAYHQILKAGFTILQVEGCINAMDTDKFWSSNGWDLMDVANQLGKGGGKFVKL